jgi:hypothetical protein
VAAFATVGACPAEAGVACKGWWSQTGSNRRPHACKARALPAELWPRTRRRMLRLYAPCELAFASATAQQPSFKKACRAEAAEQRRLVGLGRLELPTSRLSSARSNQLSYKPSTPISQKIKDWSMLARNRLYANASHKRSPWRVFVREERETKTAKSRQCSSTILTIVGH